MRGSILETVVLIAWSRLILCSPPSDIYSVEISLQTLQLNHLEKQSLLQHQLLMTSLLRNTPLIQHKYDIRSLNSRKSMGDRNGSSTTHRLIKSSLN